MTSSNWSPSTVIQYFSAVSQKSVTLKLGPMASVNIWKDSIMYDELTINERQKKDPLFSSMLNNIRVGNVSDESVSVLEQRVVKVSVFEKYQELKDTDALPVCMFATSSTLTICLLQKKGCHD